MTQPTVRQIRADEFPQLITLYQHLHPDDAPLPEADTLSVLWADILANPLLHYLVIELDQQLVSSCTLAITPNLTRGARPYGLIENVVTHQAYRQRGLGQAVLHKALEIAWQADCYKVMLMTGSKEPGTLRFYEKAGFNREEKTGFIAKPR
ncbi:MAG: GNAT family N-acetyltransferase [Chloroflexota bacterium]